MNPIQAGLCMCWLALLAGCVTQPRPPAVPPITDARAHQIQRETALAARPDWSMQGRVALSNGRDGGNGRIDWQQQGHSYVIELSAPVTRQSWRLSGDTTSARLEGLQGGTRTGSNPAQLLLEATGWRIPVTALGAWLRGARADATRYGEATLVFGSDGRLQRMHQDGWTIDYTGWRAPAEGQAELPNRLDAASGTAKVKLIVDAWQRTPASSSP